MRTILARGDARRSMARVLGVAALAGALALPAGAQHASSCSDCGGEARAAAEHRGLERQVAQLRERIGALRERYDGDVARALRQADDALRSVKVEDERSTQQVTRAHRQLREQLPAVGDDARFRDLVRQLSSLELRLAHAQIARARVPAGYLGVTYSGESARKAKDGELYIYHYDYPAVIAIEPGSPAARAGVRRGDTVLAYNRQDVRKGGVSLTRLLQPGETVTLRVRRNGETREVPVTVARRPHHYAVSGESALTHEADVRGARAVRAPLPQRVVVSPRPPVPPVPGIAPAPDPAVIFYPSGTAAVAGAELTPMNEDLQEVFGTRRGVLVLNVADRTPAAAAGLRGGDVIVRANGRDITSPAALQRELRRADSRQLSLEVVRKKQTKTVTLEW